MIWVPFLFLLTLIPFVLHGILASITAALPQGFYDALDLFFGIPRTLDGAFPVMTTLTQAILVLFFAWIGSKLWQLIAALSHFLPRWLSGGGKHPQERKER